ncbi:MAG: hypothetical protein WCW36_01065 [Candidatus Paceibacterota bacterium]
MQKFRIYALIHGQTLPLGLLSGCEIKQMDITEQKRRGFTPVQYEFSENHSDYKTYATSLPFVDPMKLHTNHVIVYDIEEAEIEAALGGAIRKFDNLCSRLFLAGIQDIRSKTDNKLYSGQTYLYQVNKIYRLDEHGDEQDVSLNLKSGHIFLPNRPERSTWHVESTDAFLGELLEFKDPVFNKALKYLYGSSVGHFRLDSYEKIALYHFKSVELIVNTLSSKESFKERVDETASILDLTQEQAEEIKKYWDARSNGDIAHSSYNDMTAFYPNQFPLPNGLEYPWAYLDSTARVVLLKYFDVRKRYFHVDIQEPYDPSEQLSLGVVNAHSECNHLFFQTSSRDKKTILNSLRNEFAKTFKINKKDVAVEFVGTKETARVFITDPTKEARIENLQKKMIRITF